MSRGLEGPRIGVGLPGAAPQDLARAGGARAWVGHRSQRRSTSATQRSRPALPSAVSRPSFPTQGVVGPVAPQEVLAATTVEMVPPGTAEQAVGAVATPDLVVTRVAAQPVVTRPRVEGVVAPTTGQHRREIGGPAPGHRGVTTRGDAAPEPVVAALAVDPQVAPGRVEPVVGGIAHSGRRCGRRRWRTLNPLTSAITTPSTRTTSSSSSSMSRVPARTVKGSDMRPGSAVVPATDVRRRAGHGDVDACRSPARSTRHHRCRRLGPTRIRRPPT